MRLKNIGSFLLFHLLLILAAVVTIYPLLWVIKIALNPMGGIPASANPFPDQFNPRNFIGVLTSFDIDGRWLFGRQLLNSIVVSLFTTVIGVVLSCTSAYAFSRFDFAGRKAGLNLLLIVQMFPGVIMAVPLYIILDRIGLLDSLMGLTLVYSITAIPFSVWMLRGYFDTIPRDLEEAAMMDGASRLRTLIQVTLPLAKPALAITALFNFMMSWNEYILAATFMNRDTSFTLPVMLQRFVGAYSSQWGMFAAGAILVSIPVMIIFFLLQKQLVTGLTAGGVKG
jgi:arabinogalactan oligomer/maltooligosaccharide transport system permease protein